MATKEKKPKVKPAKSGNGKTCLMIQWEGDYFRGGIAVCPKCNQPAEKILGVFGNPCWAHK